jgi:ATP-dependent DNA helicase RecQ
LAARKYFGSGSQLFSEGCYTEADGIVVIEEVAPASGTWLERSIRRTSAAFAAATAPADRLALLREWARLSHGTLRIDDEGIELSAEERGLLRRFGLDISDDHLMLDAAPRSLPATFQEAMRLDSSERRPYVPSPPDAALLLTSSHGGYRCETQKAAFRAMWTMPPTATLMVSMPTGTGKSLLFQAAPRAWPSLGEGCVLVITPTIALALDHERTLRTMPGLENSRAFTGQLSAAERNEILSGFRRGEIPILLMSPEIAMGAAMDALIDAALPPSDKASGVVAHLTGVVIDEAHIVESWGRSFRPDFQRLPGFVELLRRNNPALRLMLLSATLGPAARSVLKQAYGRGEWLEIHAGVPRYEFDVAASRVSTADGRDDLLLDLIDHAPRPAIVYVNKVEDAHTLHQRLLNRGYVRIAVFTGAVSDPGRRRSIIEDWAADRLDLVIATSAFGMGIDKADVRTIIHSGIPEDAARYYQEIGRAGRDGHQGIGLCIWTHFLPGVSYAVRDDETQALRMAAGSWLTIDKARPRWTRMRTLVERRRAVGWSAGRRMARFDVDAVHEELPGASSDYNRRWNMSLMNLLQRAGKLRVVSVDRDDSGSLCWNAEIIDDALFEHGSADERLWEELGTLRSAEQRQAIRDFASFRDVLSGKDQCLLSSVYRLVDPAAFAPACGRCPPCRASGRTPPTLVHCGTGEATWPPTDDRAPRLPGGTTLIEFDGRNQSMATALASLAELGFGHFVVPEGLGTASARMLAHAGSAAFVSEHSEWSGIYALPAPPRPTAVFLSSDDAASHRVWRRTAVFAAADPERPLALLAPRGLRFDGRPLEHVASTSAPYSLDALASIAASVTNNEAGVSG